ncbi:Acyl dehydratase [Tistlia consotensis]|uniref:Acyl dehydratase n=1 Tax=Tistlia consotensis USBA 355 TaxID=560819 RepID=A0A1Y6CHM0_9PROT|nr:MaoC/PaaZ C-terminal domain-containing protein [Tistlia consotensis]SMF66005.1 Acyl dehydratase [Tistlia consotensis USBA 355]SNS02834.1 Acyl dehydratase [Tistlia consotensis]
MNLDSIERHSFAPVDHAYTARDAILYALGVGCGADPLDEADLGYVYEAGLKTVPSFVNVLAHPGFWAKDPRFGIDWIRILHGEQSFEIHAPIPPEGRVRGTYRIDAVEDLGADRGARLYQSKELHAVDGTHLATVRTVLFMRGDGGQGGFGSPAASPTPLPERAPDAVVETPTLPRQALIYRLSGDLNPIHADPAAARRAGFEAPILHGLCTLGIATRAVIAARAPGAPERLRSMSLRFSKPVFPGETILTEIFGTGGSLRFRCRAKERDIVVLDRGSAELL